MIYLIRCCFGDFSVEIGVSDLLLDIKTFNWHLLSKILNQFVFLHFISRTADLMRWYEVISILRCFSTTRSLAPGEVQSHNQDCKNYRRVRCKEIGKCIIVKIVWNWMICGWSWTGALPSRNGLTCRTRRETERSHAAEVVGRRKRLPGNATTCQSDARRRPQQTDRTQGWLDLGCLTSDLMVMISEETETWVCQ